jgi:hypothetical protein
MKMYFVFLIREVLLVLGTRSFLPFSLQLYCMRILGILEGKFNVPPTESEGIVVPLYRQK